MKRQRYSIAQHTRAARESAAKTCVGAGEIREACLSKCEHDIEGGIAAGLLQQHLQVHKTAMSHLTQHTRGHRGRTKMRACVVMPCSMQLRLELFKQQLSISCWVVCFAVC